MHQGDVADADLGPRLHLDGHPGELLDAAQELLFIGDVVLDRPDADRNPGRLDQVRGEQRLDDVARPEAVGARPLGVDVDDDLALLAASGGRRRREARDREEPDPEEVQPVVEELLLGARAARDLDVIICATGTLDALNWMTAGGVITGGITRVADCDTCSRCRAMAPADVRPRLEE